MLPSEKEFRKNMKNIDVRIGDNIVCYDKLDSFSAMRVYWMLRTFGAPNVRLLNGSFSKWKKERRPTSAVSTPVVKRTRSTQAKDTDYHFVYNKDRVVEFDDI